MSEDKLKVRLAIELERPRYESVRFCDYARGFFSPACAWVRRQTAKGKTLSAYWIKQRRQHLDKYIGPAFERKYLHEITAVAIENWIAGLTSVDKHRKGQPVSGQTKKHVLGTMKIIMHEAFRENKIERDPFDQVDPVHVRHEARAIYDIKELKAMFPVDDPEALAGVWGSYMIGALAFVILSCGLRSGEGRALQWQDILTVGKRQGLRICRAVKGGSSTVGETKSGDIRAVILPKRAQTVLDAWRTVAEWTGPDDLVFSFFRGQPMDAHVLLRGLKHATKKAGVDLAGRDIHCLRHTYRTMMAQKVPEAALNYMIGHKSESVARRYDHTTPEDRLKAIAGAMPLELWRG